MLYGTGRPWKKPPLFVVLLLLFVCSLSFPARANAPAPSTFFAITLENAPDDAYAVDFLIPEEKIPPEEYTECNGETLKEAGLSPDCELAKMNHDGYVSLMAHVSRSLFDGELYAEPQYGGGKEGDLFTRPIFSCYDLLVAKDISDSVRLAVFDREGHILAVSEPFEVMRSTPYRDYSMVTYNVSDGKAMTVRLGNDEENGGRNGGDRIILAIITLVLLAVAAVITMIVEFLLALAFGLKPAWWTLLVNFFSNAVFNLLLVIFCIGKANPVPYEGFLLVGELLVVLLEFLVYRMIYKNLSGKRLLCYSFAANLASFAAALVITVMTAG